MCGKKFLVYALVVSSLCFSGGISYFSEQSPTFNKSPNGYGWFQGYNRKVQVCLSPYTGITGGSVFRTMTDGDNNTIGGMTCNWEGSFSGYSQELPYYSLGDWSGARYPHTASFINGYLFGQFNHYTLADTDSNFASFTVGDATFGWGWDEAQWTIPRIVEAKNGATPPQAWQGTGDVVYDPETGYYYWTQGWKEGLSHVESPISCVVGRTKTPADPDSWVWTDFNDLCFDLDCYIGKKETDYDMMTGIQFAYAKDSYGNGTGKGIGVAVTRQSWTGMNRISYTLTHNWGADSLSGSLKPNWSKDFYGLSHIHLLDKFDWLGETLTLTDSTGYNVNTNTIVNGTGTVTVDIPYILWDIAVLMTAADTVHILCMVFPSTTDPAYQNVIFPKTDSGFKAGYYDIRGVVSEKGVIWSEAVFIANPVDVHKGWGDNGMEFRTELNRTLTISCMDDGVILAGWLDKPWSRAYPFDPYDTQKKYKFLNDGFIIASTDNGQIWESSYNIDVETGNPEDPIHTVEYAYNATKNTQVHFEGWSFSNNAFRTTNRIETYAATQTADYAGMQETYLDHEQYLNLWKVGYYYSGIQEDNNSVASDFELFQNYPNPFNPATEIKFSIAEKSKVNLSVYNTNGQLVKTLLDGKTEKGLHSVKFHGEELNSGIYFYRLEIGGVAETRKMIMLK
jgi:hypothetical protein